MIANLYLHPDTFVHNGVDSKKDVCAKLIALVDDMAKVVYEHNDENRFKVPASFPCVHVYKEMTIIDLAEQCLDNDGKGVFYSMLTDTSDSYDTVSLDELREMCTYRIDEEVVNSILVFNVPIEDLSEHNKADSEQEAKMAYQAVNRHYITFDKYEVVYSKQTWMNLRRQILGNHPGTPKTFVEECGKYFPNLCFHKNCESSLIDGDYNYLETSPRKLVYYLSCLNDKFFEIYKTHKTLGSNANTLLEDFSGMYGLDEPGSLQQRPEKKEALTFCFKKNDDSKCDVICEPHLKISQEDENCKCKNINYSKFHPRIYFYFPQSDVENGRIPVGSMGKHI